VREIGIFVSCGKNLGVSPVVIRVEFKVGHFLAVEIYHPKPVVVSTTWDRLSIKKHAFRNHEGSTTKRCVYQARSVKAISLLAPRCAMDQRNI
jgi:hypothetical protein